MRRAIIALALLSVLAGCQVFRAQPPAPMPSFFIVFFVPSTAQLTPEAQAIVRQAAMNAMGTRVSRIEVAVPTDAMGGASLREARFTAIQNILSAVGVDPRIQARAQLSAMAAMLPGAADRAEIRLLP